MSYNLPDLDPTEVGDANKSETTGVRLRIDASTWEARPAGYKTVLTIGPDPSPNDMEDGDVRIVTLA